MIPSNSLKAVHSLASRRLLVLLASLGSTLHAADVFKDNNTNDMFDGSSWVGATAPGTTDIAVFDDRIVDVPLDTTFNLRFMPLNSSVTWGGIKIVNNGPQLALDTFGGGGATVNITLGTSGIDGSGATAGNTFTFDNPTLVIPSSTTQTWSIADGATLHFKGPVSRGAGATLNFNLGTTGTGAIILDDSAFGAGGALSPYATVNRKDFLAVSTASGSRTAAAGGSVLTYTQNPNTGANNPNMGASTVTVLDVVNSNTSGTATAVRVTGNWGLSGFRFATPHATGLDWTVNSDTTRNLSIGAAGGGILVAPEVGAKNVIFNGNPQFRFGGTNALTDFYLHQHNTQGDLILNNPLNGQSNNHRIVKDGAGRAIIAGANSLTGAVYIAEGTLQLGNGGTTGTVGGAVTNNGVLAFNRSDSPTFSLAVSGTGAVTNSGSGTLFLSGSNTFTGPVNLNAGTLSFSTLANLGAGSVINFNGGAIQWGAGNTIDLSARSLVFGAGGARFDTNGNNVTLASSIGGGGAGGLTKLGTGSLTLQGANSYSGLSTVNAGKLIIANTGGSATGSGNVAVSAGGTLAGTGTISGTVSTTVGSIIEPGNGGVGTLTAGGLSLASGSILDLEFASTSSHDRVVTTASNGLTVNGGGLRLFSAGSSTPYAAEGTFNLLGFSGAVQGSGPASLSVLNPQAGYSYSFGASGGFVTLNIIQDSIPSHWTSTGGGSWGSSSNWGNGVPTTGYTAQFTAALGAPATVTLDGNRTVNGMVFNSAQGYTIASGTSGSLTLQKSGGAATNVLAGNHTISAPVVLASNLGVTTASGTSLTLSGTVSGSGGLSKDGPGLLSLTGHNTFSGAINAVNGVLGFSFADSLGSGSITLNGATLLFNAGNTADISSKTINFGLNGAAIDTNDNDVVFANSIGNSGDGFFSKTGAGSLTLSADSTYLGQTFVKGGELIIASNGSLGPVASAQALNLDGGLLVPGATMTLDNAGANARPVVVGAAGGGFLVPAGLALTVPGAISGGGQLSKSGAGDLIVTGSNTGYVGGVLMEGGSIQLGTDRATQQTGLGTGPIRFGGNSTLYLNGVGIPDNNNSFGALTNAIVVPAGVTAEIRTPSRGGYTGAASGVPSTVDNVTTYGPAGTINLYVDGTRFDMSGVWPNFDGTLNVHKTPTGDGTDTDDYRLAVAHNMVAGKMHVGAGVKVYQTFNPPTGTGTFTVHNFGELTADQGAILEGNPVSGRYNTYSVGALNTNFTIDGQFRGSLNTFGYGYPSLTKVGTGTLTLNNSHMMAAPITVSAGTLKVQGAIERFYTGVGADGAYGRFPVDTGTCDDTISLTPPATEYQNTEPGALTVAAAATLAGNGSLGGAITVNGTLRPDSTGDLGGNLTLTGAASLTLASTATTQFDFKGANFTGVKSTASGANTYGGVLKFNFTGTVFNGSYKVFDLAVAPTGAFTSASVTTTTSSESALANSGSIWSGTVGAQSYSFDASTGILTVSGGSTAVTPGASTLSATVGDATVNLSWTSASGADAYTVKRSTTQGGPYTNVIANLAGTAYSDTGLTNGTTYYYVVQAKNSTSNLSGANSNEVSATPVGGPAHTALQTWRFEQFGVYDDTGSVLAGDTEDFDGDGLANLLEYALGTNPTVANANPVTVAKSGNFLTLTYPRRSTADAGLAYTVQGSNDLTGGFTAAGGSTNTVGTTSTYTDDVNVSTAGARRFLRLSVSYTAP